MEDRVRAHLLCIEKDLRRAVESQNHIEVQRLVLAFCQAAEAQARALPPGDARIGEIAAMTQEVLQWTRTMVQSARASLVLNLRQVPKLKRYVPVPSAPLSRVRLDV
jgi:hypothetical protein